MASIASSEKDVSPQEKASNIRRRKRRAKSKKDRSYKGKIESSTGPQEYKDSRQYKLAKKGEANRENPLHKLLTTLEGPGYEITRFLPVPELLDVRLLTTKTDTALSDSMSFDVENDVKFKREWEKNRLDTYLYG